MTFTNDLIHFSNEPINEVVISPVYDDFFEKASDDYILSIDKVRFASDPIYSKTLFACLDNDLPYEDKHYENISAIDKFISKQNIIDVIVACGSYVGGGYRFVKEDNEWIYVLPFDKKGLLAFIDRKQISIKQIEEDAR